MFLKDNVIKNMVGPSSDVQNEPKVTRKCQQSTNQGALGG